MGLTVTSDENTLFCQATGQSSFPLEPYENQIFKFDPADITITFSLEVNKFTIDQAGSKTVFLKQ